MAVIAFIIILSFGDGCAFMGIHESGRWWDLTYWSCAEYWYDLACLSIRREMVTLSFMKILSLCSLFLLRYSSNAWKAKKYWYENCKYLGSIPNILQFSPSLSIQGHLHYLLYEIACSHDVTTECLSPEQTPATFYMGLYIIYVSVWEPPVPVWACICICSHITMWSRNGVLCVVTVGKLMYVLHPQYGIP